MYATGSGERSNGTGGYRIYEGRFHECRGSLCFLFFFILRIETSSIHQPRLLRYQSTMLTSRTSACAPGAETNTGISMLKSKSKPTVSSKPNTIWSHAPSQITLLWLAISLPLVTWDTGYVLLRPLTMEGGSLHWPLWVPYKLYGTVDHVYGWKSFNAKNGFTGAQGFLNLIETLMYAYYLLLCWKSGKVVVDHDGKTRRCVAGRDGAKATLMGFSAAVMTLSKTVLYCEMSISL